jgi:hypothetical protein
VPSSATIRPCTSTGAGRCSTSTRVRSCPRTPRITTATTTPATTTPATTTPAHGHDHAGHDHASARTATAGPTVESAAALELPAPLERTFELESRPGAKRTIYLDAHGRTLTGTGWNDITAGAPIELEPFGFDADPAFSAAELETLQRVWQRVAEDYAPFAVNVTTRDPGPDAITRSGPSDDVFGARAVLTAHDPSSSGLCGGCAGLAYVDVFDIPDAFWHAFYQPALIFVSPLQPDPGMIADTVSHEVGHNLGLGHQKEVGSEYAYGQGLWAPIMGSSLYPLGTWSDGVYARSTSTQDDVEIIAASGAPLAADDHGNDADTATPIGASGLAEGVIERRDDEDWFRFTAAGATTVTATPAPEGPNLDVELQVVGTDGTTVLGVDDPPSSWPYFGQAPWVQLGVPVTGLDAAVTLQLEAGTYYARVRGVGAGDPLVDGYSDYGSLGRYTVEVASDGTEPPLDPPVVTITSGPAALTNVATATFVFTSDRPGTSFACRVNSGTWQSCSSPRTVTVSGQGAQSFQVRGSLDGVTSAPAGYSWTVDTVAPVLTISGTPAQGASTTATTASFTWSANEQLNGPISCRYTFAGTVQSWQPNCHGGVQLSNLPTGTHRVEVRGTDLAGNLGTSSRTWTVTAVTSPPPSSEPSPTFSDVTPGSTHAANITILAQRGVTLGCGGGRFCPDQAVTRDQMATFLGRALPLREGSSSPPFRDVAAGSTHARYIDAVRREGITLGCGDGTRYCPGDVVQRDQMASFLTRAMGYEPGSASPPFRDVAPGSTHARAIDALRREEVTTGCSAPRSYCPGASVTRAQMATFLVRALGW